MFFKAFISALIETLASMPISHLTLGFTQLERVEARHSDKPDIPNEILYPDPNDVVYQEFEVCPIDDHSTYGVQV